MTDSTHMTELDLLVGSIFTTRPEEDRELFEEEREWLSDIQDLLREEGVEADLLSRPGVEIWEGGIEHVELPMLRSVLTPLVDAHLPGLGVEALVHVALGSLYGAALYIARSAKPRAARAEVETVLDTLIVGLQSRLDQTT